MNVQAVESIPVLAARVADAARLMRLLSSERRLLVLCILLARGEMSVGSLAEEVGLSQPALSQHLAMMRAEGLVATRRAAQTIYYRIADTKVEQVLEALHKVFCSQL